MELCLFASAARVSGCTDSGQNTTIVTGTANLWAKWQIIERSEQVPNHTRSVISAFQRPLLHLVGFYLRLRRHPAIFCPLTK
jgi:hypothetical protein